MQPKKYLFNAKVIITRLLEIFDPLIAHKKINLRMFTSIREEFLNKIDGLEANSLEVFGDVALFEKVCFNMFHDSFNRSSASSTVDLEIKIAR